MSLFSISKDFQTNKISGKESYFTDTGRNLSEDFTLLFTDGGVV